MLTRALILSLLALSGVNAQCQCYTTPGSTVTGTKVSVSNGYSSSDFSSCYVAGGCGFVAYSGSATVGWSNITITFSTSADKTGKFIIYDGKTNDTNTAQAATYTVDESGTKKQFTSSTPYIYVLYTQSDATKPNAYFGNLMAGSSFAAPVTVPPPTSAPVTRAFNNSLYPFDTYFISHDIMILVNQKTNQGITGLTALNDIAKQFVNLLSVTKDYPAGESQTRLGLATITPYAPNYAAQGEIWSMNATDVVQALPQSGVSINVDILNALKQVVPVFFNVSSTTAPTRKNVQRSVLLLTAWWDEAAASLDTVKDIFDQYGVNLAIIGYNTVYPNNLASNSWYNYVSLTTTSDQDVANFVNRYYLNSGYGGNSLINNWCKKGNDSASGEGFFQEPSNYGGPPVGPPAAITWSSTTGQSQRYCNFQDTTYTYNRQTVTKKVAFTVFYELEVEQDFLKFYADGVEVESFTGMDVGNAYFELDANVTTARFTTDSAGVRRGFYVEVEEK